MLVCRSCGSLQFSDVGKRCPACGASDGFDHEDNDYSHGISFDDEDSFLS